MPQNTRDTEENLREEKLGSSLNTLVVCLTVRMARHRRGSHFSKQFPLYHLTGKKAVQETIVVCYLPQQYIIFI